MAIRIALTGGIGLIAALGLSAAGVRSQCCGTCGGSDAATPDVRPTSSGRSAPPQSKCPIMGVDVDRKSFVDVGGKRVYVCCEGCVDKVKADPQGSVAKIMANGEQPEEVAIRGELDTGALAVLLRSGVAVHVFDARTGKYDDGRRIPGAGSLSALSTAEQVAAAIPDKGALVVTYCSNVKCPASGSLAEHLRKLGYRNVLEYSKGIEGWTQAGYLIETVK